MAGTNIQCFVIEAYISLITTDNFSSLGKAIIRLCVCLSLCVSGNSIVTK